MGKKIIFISYFLLLCCIDTLYAQSWPVVVNNTNVTPFNNLRIRSAADISGTRIDSIAPGISLVATTTTTGITVTDGSSFQQTSTWYLVDIPTTSSTVRLQGYCAAGCSFSNPLCSVGYVNVTTAVTNIRTDHSIGASNFVLIGGLHAHGIFNQNFALSSSSTPYFDGIYLWYQIDLTNNCSQSYGWVRSDNVNLYTSGTNGLAQPTTPSSGSITSSSAFINWTESYYPYNTTFTVYNASSGSVLGTASNGSVFSYTPQLNTISSLSSCTSYSVYVRASLGSCISSNSSNSPSFTTTGCGSPPPTPTGLSANAASCSSISLSWSSSSGATNYDVYTCSGTYIGSTSSTSYPISFLSPSTTYSYMVRATNSYGNSSFSGCQGATTPACPPPPPSTPTGFTATATSCSSIGVSWSSASGATSYDIYTCSGSYITTVTGTNCNITSLSQNTSYSFKVMAVNSGGTSSFTSCQGATTPFCSPPSILSLSLSSSSTHNVSYGATVSFSTSASFSPFTYYCSVRGGVPYAANTYSSSSPSFSVPFTNAGAYNVSMQASNSAGLGSIFSSVNNYVTVLATSLNAVIPPKSFAIQQGYPSYHAAEPINIATGAYEYKHNDFSIPGVNTVLNFTRYYNSVNNTTNSSLGYGWSNSFDVSVTNQADSAWVVKYGDGHISTFIPYFDSGGKSFPLYGGIYEKLVKDTVSGIFTMTFKNGSVFHFDATTGKLDSIFDLNGNLTVLNYSGGLLSTVVAPGGRELTFSYTGSNISTVTDPLGRTITYNYDGSGNLIQATDANGGNTNFTYTGIHLIQQINTPNGNVLLKNYYDSQNRVDSQLDAFNNLTSIAYNVPSTGDATITNPDGSTKIVHHDSFYRLIQETNELGYSRSYKYDYNNNIDTFIDENGRTLTFGYDSVGNIIKTVGTTGLTTQIRYNFLNKPVSITNPIGNIDSMVYDTHGNATLIILPNGSQLRVSYSSTGLVDTVINVLGVATSYQYTTRGDLASITTPSGLVSFFYDSSGRLLSIADENSHTSQINYDSNNHIIQIIDPNNDSVHFAYDADDNLISQMDRKGYATYFFYDIKDRLTKIQDAGGNIYTKGYNSRDKIISDTDANGNVTLFGYDAVNQMISLTNSLGTFHIGYNAVGNKTSDTDALGNVKLYTYDSLNQLTIAQNELGNTTQYTYDSLGHITGIKDLIGRTTLFHFDNTIGKIVGVTDALHFNTSATYDLMGKIVSLTDPKTHVQNFRYNSSDRQSSLADGSGIIDSMVYDGVGNITTKINTLGTITKNYDALNRVTHITNTGGNNYDYTYDVNGNLLSAHNSTGTSQFVYDSLNRLKQYIDMFNDTVSYTYDSVGNKKTIQYPGGHVVNYGYNNDNMLISLTDWLGHITRYIYNANGHVTASINPFGDTCKYAYDNAGRKVSQTNVIGSTIISKNIFTLDANGNKILDNPVKGSFPKHLAKSSNSFSYNATDYLTSDSIASYSNDANGNRKLSQNGTIRDSFSVDNFLISRTDTIAATFFYYDALGNRVARKSGSNFRRFVLDLTGNLSQVLQELDSSGVIKANYIYGLGLVARIDSAGNILYYHFDAQHNTIALTNDSGTVTDTYTYEPFGKMLKHKGNSQQPFTFSGQFGVQSENYALYYMRARYYDAGNHRFLSKDPYPAILTNPQTLNRYVYGLNNPITNFDPLGLISFGTGFRTFWDVVGVASNISALAIEEGGLVGLDILTDGLATPALIPLAVGIESARVISIANSINDVTRDVNAISHNSDNIDSYSGIISQKYVDKFKPVIETANVVSIVSDIPDLVKNVSKMSSKFSDIAEEVPNIEAASSHITNTFGYSSQAIIGSLKKIIKPVRSIMQTAHDAIETLNTAKDTFTPEKKCGN